MVQSVKHTVHVSYWHTCSAAIYFPLSADVPTAILLESIHLTCVQHSVMFATHHVARYNTPIHNILSTAPQLSISQKVLGRLPDDGNVMPKHVGATTHN
jgi:hypothetical protein